MAWTLFTHDNDFRVKGTLYVDTKLYLGFTGVAGTNKDIEAIGSGPNISVTIKPKGTSTIQTPAGYDALIVNDVDIVNKKYVDSKIAGKSIFTTISAIGVGQNGQAIIWDNTNSRWTMGATSGSSYTFASGTENVAGTVKLGGTNLDRHTTIAGPFNLLLGASGNALNAFSSLALTTSIVSSAGSAGGFYLGLGGFAATIQGGSPLSTLTWSSGGVITLGDGTTTPRGLRAVADYSANVQNTDYIQKIYADNRLGGKLVSTLLQTPTVTENDFSVVWDNVLGKYTLKLVSGGSGGGSSNSKEQQFVANGSQSVFTVSNGTLSLLSFVDVNGNVQRNGINYTRSGQDIDFGVAPPAGSTITIHYFESLVVGGSGGGHLIMNGPTPLPQRANLSFANALTASDNGTNTLVEFGGILTRNTNVVGAGFTFTGSGFSSYQFNATTDVTLGTAVGATLTINNQVIHRLILGQTAGVILDIGGDVNGDMYQRIGNKLTRIPIGAVNTVLKSTGTQAAWSTGTGDTIIKNEVFTSNGSQSNFTTITGSIQKINFVSVNGVIQTPAAYIITGNTVSFGVNIANGFKVHISYFENVSITNVDIFNLDGGAPDTVIVTPALIIDGGTV